MSETEVLDKTFHFILKRMVASGQAPHYTEIAAELGVSPEDGRQTMHLKNWVRYDPATAGGISQLEGLLAMFSSNLFKRRTQLGDGLVFLLFYEFEDSPALKTGKHKPFPVSQILFLPISHQPC